MDDGDVIERIEGHLARGNELFHRLDEELRLSRLSRERSDAQGERLFAAFQRLTRALAQRFERAEERTERALQSFEQTVDAFDRKLDDSVAESESHRDALFKILDRLGPDGSSAAA